ncbi:MULTISPECIES: glycosyltransferase family 4 protein [Cyanophyceae]|nr:MULTISPECIES: glycosyltransferase family 4 protein [unclassified Trichocoleus]MBD1906029.1 glycosyltransferase family 4 protein [Trichocoleus sp. FACHB-832]MBD2061974.1 glycosyltransferase family 4 protein [Trichocoleus sp. FACHB-6]
MKVLNLNPSDPFYSSGGAVAMYSLHLGLRKAEIDSKILCKLKKIESSHIQQIPRNKRIKIVEFLIKQVTSRSGLNDINAVNTFNIKKTNAYQEADIFHIHGMHRGYSYLALPSLTEHKPTVFTLHDMWSFTGHCSYSYDCDRWKIGCGKCPYPKTHPAVERDNTHLEWKLKDWVYSRSNMTIITPSSWMTKLAKESLLQRFPIHHIPNGIDTEIYQPLDSQMCRSVLGVPSGKKALMFVAASLQERRKGGDLLTQALKSLPESVKTQIVLLLIGNGGEALAEAVDIPTLNFGFVTDKRLKTICYSAADLFIFPSREDNLPLVLQESMACGTPMVSFKIGGIPDLVRPGITGYLAEAENVEDFRNGIVQLLDDDSLRQEMSQQCRAIAEKEYSSELQIQRHIELYRQLLQYDVKEDIDYSSFPCALA